MKLIVDNKQIDDILVTAAITKAEQVKGLMLTTENNKIMLFPYKKSEIRKFWMHQTYIPLDIVFCSNGKVVGIYSGEPFDDKNLIGPNVESDLVFETPRGYCKSHSIDIESDVNIKFDKKNFRKFLKEG